MKRNMALVRAILEAVEATPPFHKISLSRTDHAALADYEQTEIDAHAELLSDGGLLRVTFTPQIGRPSIHAVRGLTWQGHDYLDALRNPPIVGELVEGRAIPTDEEIARAVVRHLAAVKSSALGADGTPGGALERVEEPFSRSHR